MKKVLASLMPLVALPALATGTLTVCTEASPEGFDIAQYTAIVTMDASMEPIFNRLVEFKRGSTELQPGLARSWQISPDQRVYTFQLRPDVAFHSTDYFKPTRKLNADDVVWSLRRMIDPQHPWHKLAQNGFPYAAGMELPELIKSVEKVDPLTVRITLNRPEAPFLADLAMGFASIYSAEYADQLLKAGTPEKLNHEPIGTGPFRFVKYQKDAFIRYQAFNQYFRGKPAIDRLNYAITTDPSVRVQKLKTNECQIALYPRPAEIATLKTDPAIKVLGSNILMTSYLAFNTKKPYLDNVKVRQALSLAVDKSAYNKALFGEGGARNAKNPYPPAMWSYNDKIRDYDYNPEKARQLLKEAGYPNGFNLTLWTRNGGGPSNPNPKMGAEMLQADWARIGVKTSIVVMEWGALLKQARKGEHEVFVTGWTGDNGDPDNFLSPQLSCAAEKDGSNFARYCDSELDKLLDQGKAQSDVKARSAIYRQAQLRIKQNAPWLTLSHPTTWVATRSNVSGYVINPLGTNNFSMVSIK